MRKVIKKVLVGSLLLLGLQDVNPSLAALLTANRNLRCTFFSSSEPEPYYTAKINDPGCSVSIKVNNLLIIHWSDGVNTNINYINNSDLVFIDGYPGRVYSSISDEYRLCVRWQGGGTYKYREKIICIENNN